MTFDELMQKIGEVLPHAITDTGSGGEVVIFTGMVRAEDGTLVRLKEDF